MAKKLYIDMNGLHAYNCEFKEKVKIVIEKKNVFKQVHDISWEFVLRDFNAMKKKRFLILFFVSKSR